MGEPTVHRAKFSTLVGLMSNVVLIVIFNGETRNTRVRHQKRSGHRKQAHGMLLLRCGKWWSPAPTRKIQCHNTSCTLHITFGRPKYL